MPFEEPTLHDESDLPNGYKFIRAGDPYITKNCRAFTHKAGRTVYVIRNTKKGISGIGVPIHVWKSVQRLNDETREQRKEAIKRKDTALNKKVKTELLKRFPQIPQERIDQIIQHMLKKRSRRVGRSKDVSPQQMVTLGVVAHIRHKLTDYDRLLREGIVKEQARSQVQRKIDEVVRTWGTSSLKETKLIQKRTTVIKPRKKPVIKSARRSSLRLKARRESGKRTIDPSSSLRDNK